MSIKLLTPTVTAALLASTAMADVPSVAVDIAPVHSLVARVMQGVGSPDLIIPSGASPHEYNLRPSEASALQDADVVFWMGEDLTPWMENAVETLAEGAAVTTLLELDETSLLDFREGALFEEHDHGDREEHGHDEHAEDDHDHEHGEEKHAEDDHDHDHGEEKHAEDDHDHDHGEEEHAEDDHDHDHGEEKHAEDDHDHDHGEEKHAEDDHDHDHGEEKHAEDDHDHDHGEEKHAEDDHDHDHDHGDEDHAGHDGHDHGEHDPHAWLSPDNASAWLNVIAAKLSAADPDNAGAYFANAAAGQAEIEALKGEISAILDPARGKSFVVFHDAYQYFEVAFDFPASGAISLGDATDPSPARITEIQDRVKDEGVECVLAEPQYNPGIVAVVIDGTGAKTGVLDPLGSELEPGADLYPQLMRNLAGTLAGCL